MTIERAIDSIWRSGQAGVYFPEEWKGKLSQRQGYDVQLGILTRHIAAGDAHVGWKVGLTAKATQDHFGLYEPVFGFLLRSGAKPSGGSWPDWCGKRKWRILPAVGSWLTQSRPPGKAATGGMRHGRAYQEWGAAA
jgi:hypothetical protein